MKKKNQPKTFQKFKRRLGTARGLKKKSATQTDLTLHTRIINLQTQSVSEDKSDHVTHRKLELKDLLVQLSHYNDTVRKDALLGMKELFVLHPSILPLHLSEIIERSVEKMVDLSSIVRKALHALLSHIFSTLSPELISPLSKFLLFT
eukprot:TRINITY_DN6834_c0_g1_i5.p2 TRINITY_DN6834_c0_g1~~TRINITY_DN6834_c0_g1_i5.p2  ORF type:complete len:148 (-),score=29.82 TRINITY_DN6834_c0_g1_i5:596-1039(-)